VISRSLEITCGTKLTIPLNDTGHFVLIASIQRTSLFLSVCYRRNAHGTPLKEKRKAGVLAKNATPISDDEMAESGQH
ncbi:hypothetical protein ACNGVJ_004809, partial [Escherichia coli]